jgi:hypothetical protein
MKLAGKFTTRYTIMNMVEQSDTFQFSTPYTSWIYEDMGDVDIHRIAFVIEGMENNTTITYLIYISIHNNL